MSEVFADDDTPTKSVVTSTITTTATVTDLESQGKTSTILEPDEPHIRMATEPAIPLSVDDDDDDIVVGSSKEAPPPTSQRAPIVWSTD